MTSVRTREDDERLLRALAMHDRKCPHADIARRLGGIENTWRTSISRVWREYAASLRKPVPVRKETRADRVAAMLERGMTSTEIAAAEDTSIATIGMVIWRLRKAGKVA